MYTKVWTYFNWLEMRILHAYITFFSYMLCHLLRSELLLLQLIPEALRGT